MQNCGSRQTAQHHDVDEFEPATFDSDSDEAEDSFHLQDGIFNADTLMAAYHSISKAWHRESRCWTAVPPLAPRDNPNSTLRPTNPSAARYPTHSCVRNFWPKVRPTVYIAGMGNFD